MPMIQHFSFSVTEAMTKTNDPPTLDYIVVQHLRARHAKTRLLNN